MMPAFGIGPRAVILAQPARMTHFPSFIETGADCQWPLRLRESALGAGRARIWILPSGAYYVMLRAWRQGR